MARPVNAGQIGRLYFIRSEQQQAVKVGFATEVYSRLKSLQTGNPSDLDLALNVGCTYGAELAFHRLMKKRAIRLEWYPDDEVIFFLENEIQDEILDRAMEWLDEHAPNAVGVDVLTDAMNRQVLTADDIEALVKGALADEVAA